MAGFRRFRPVHTLTVERVPDAVLRLLTEAARRRNISLDEAVIRILAHTLYVGSQSRCLDFYFDSRNPDRLLSDEAFDERIRDYHRNYRKAKKNGNARSEER
jgi:hypothetical protein